MTHATLGQTLATLLTVAWLLPLAGFVVEIFMGVFGVDRKSRVPAYFAVACIGLGFVLSVAALLHWGTATAWGTAQVDDDGTLYVLPEEEHAGGHEDGAHADGEHADGEHGDHGHEDPEHASAGEHGHDGHHAHPPSTPPFSGTLYTLARFGGFVFGIDWYVDSLTLGMFVMVTLIATCIHVFAIGYMDDELTEDHVDHEVHLPGGGHLHRPGRYYAFFGYFSLFSFSMLGLVLAGNVFQVFVFWELVGICSYLLIGFYVERKSANVAANKAFVMNRVGDFGFLIGLMVLITSLGTFRFFDHELTAEDGSTREVPGLFHMVRGDDGSLMMEEETGHVVLRDAEGHVLESADGPLTIPYTLLTIAGLGIFAGCVGKSAQFPLQTWLPDAMEGPTPVSALVHSATMVAAGVYLAGRVYPLFTPDVLLVIAYVGCITLFVAATIAIVATDIKRVLAYSTISQLGYMMLGIGVGGWAAGLFHLITHAFFKSLMFLCSGSVIHACHHEQEMPRMGGLWRKMPVTAFTMLVGVIAISGLALPGITFPYYAFLEAGEPFAFSGFHSKDAIVATSLAFSRLNDLHFLLFLVPLVTAGITAFYMFRLWFFTFAGQPRDQHVYDHCHESPWVMTGPLVLLAVFAAFCAVGGEGGPLFGLIAGSEPAGVAQGVTSGVEGGLALPGHEAVHAQHAEAGAYALFAAFLGTLVAWLLYGLRVVNPAEIGRQLSSLHAFLAEKWRFDELYDTMFVRPVHVVAAVAAWFDRVVLDGILHFFARATVWVATIDRRIDEGLVDGLVNVVGSVVYSAGRSLRVVQTGQLRQYIVFIAVGVLTLFVLLFAFFPGV